MKKIVFYLFIVSSLLFSDNAKSDTNAAKQELEQNRLAEEDLKREKIGNYISEIKEIEHKIAKKDSVWMKSYASYLTSLEVRESLEEIKSRIEFLQKKRDKSLSESDELSA